MKKAWKWIKRLYTGAVALFVCAAGGTLPASASAQKSLKILAIGNSFSEDATRYLYDIAADQGVDDIVVGNLYIGGCSLNTHWKNAENNNPSYIYYKNNDGQWTTQSGYSILKGLEDEDWDVVTLQQVSGLSGDVSTYNDDLINLLAYVRAHAGPDVKIAWHMTWAYQGNSTHPDFPRYDRDQMTMYEAIVDATQAKIVGNDAVDLIIPAGTAVQNVRTSVIGDTLTRDGYHLSNLGRYVAGLTWAKSLGLPLDGLKTLPDGVSASDLPVLREAVEQSVEHPFEVSGLGKSYDLTQYTELEWEHAGCAYWNSGAGTTLVSKENSTAGNLVNFVASVRRFTREELPVGTLLVVDPGYQYRPEGWRGEAVTPSADRPNNVTAQFVEVDDVWWGDFTHRAFNVSVQGGTADISDKVEETASHFRIYIPKKDPSGTVSSSLSAPASSASSPGTGRDRSWLPVLAVMAVGSAVLGGLWMFKRRQGKHRA